MNKIVHLLMFGCLLSTCFVAAITFTSEAKGSAAVVANNCRCGRASCRKCRPGIANRIARRRSCRQCPNCNSDVCELKVECVKEKKTCFEVEQKVICIPKFSWPPRRSCNCKSCDHPCCGDPCENDCDCQCRCSVKCGKAKTINVLKTKKYECKSCKYRWTVVEPQGCDSGANDTDVQQSQFPTEQASPAVGDDIEQPGFEQNELYDPSGADVPTPPATNRINN